MAYYVRIFCASSEVPTLTSIASWVATKGVRLDIVPVRGGIDSRDWSEAEVSQAGRAVRFHVGVNRVDASSEIALKEIDEFREMVLATPESTSRQEVLDHLARTKLIVANRIPTGAFEGADYDALGYFCEFIVHAGGMVQADGEGFYRGKELILPLR